MTINLQDNCKERKRGNNWGGGGDFREREIELKNYNVWL